MSNGVASAIPTGSRAGCFCQRHNDWVTVFGLRFLRDITASAQSIDRFDRLLRTCCAIYGCPSRAIGRSWPHNPGMPVRKGYVGAFDNGRNAVRHTILLLLAMV